MTIPYYVEHSYREDATEIYERFIAANPNLHLADQDAQTLGGLLISRPNARWGYRDSYEKWGTVGAYDKAMDHIECFYDTTARRVVLVSMPNMQLNDNGRCSCGCIEKLIAECDRVSYLHQGTNPGKKNSGENLVVHIGMNGTSWRKDNHPLIVVASNRVSIKLD